MADERLPKAVFYEQLKLGSRAQGHPKKRYKDMLKEHLKQCHIDPPTWENMALDRTAWRSACDVGVSQFEDSRIAEDKRRDGYARPKPPMFNQPAPTHHPIAPLPHLWPSLCCTDWIDLARQESQAMRTHSSTTTGDSISFKHKLCTLYHDKVVSILKCSINIQFQIVLLCEEFSYLQVRQTSWILLMKQSNHRTRIMFFLKMFIINWLFWC